MGDVGDVGGRRDTSMGTRHGNANVLLCVRHG